MTTGGDKRKMKTQIVAILAIIAVITALITVSAVSNEEGYNVSPCDAIDISLENTTVTDFLNATNMTTVQVYNFKGYKGENTWRVQWSSSDSLLDVYVNVATGNVAGIEEKTTPAATPTPWPTPAVTTTPWPTPEATPTPTPTPTPEPIALSGRGQEATSKFSLEKGLSIFKMTHDGDRNFIVWLFDDEGDRIDLLVNEIGDFDGSKAVGIEKQGDYLLDINADGRWTITIEQPRPSYAPPVPKTLKGKGRHASEMFHLDKGLARFEMTHDGDRNFAIWLFDDEGDRIDLLVNEIGDFDGSKAVSISKGGIYLLDINADGNWKISIE